MTGKTLSEAIHEAVVRIATLAMIAGHGEEEAWRIGIGTVESWICNVEDAKWKQRAIALKMGECHG